MFRDVTCSKNWKPPFLYPTTFGTKKKGGVSFCWASNASERYVGLFMEWEIVMPWWEASFISVFRTSLLTISACPQTLMVTGFNGSLLVVSVQLLVVCMGTKVCGHLKSHRKSVIAKNRIFCTTHLNLLVTSQKRSSAMHCTLGKAEILICSSERREKFAWATSSYGRAVIPSWSLWQPCGQSSPYGISLLQFSTTRGSWI